MAASQGPKPPLATTWVASGDRRGADAPPEPMASFPAEVGYAHGALHPLQAGSFLFDVESRFAVPVTIGAKVLFDEPILALRIPTSGRAVIRPEALPSFEESAETWNLSLVANTACEIEQRQGEFHQCLVGVFTRSRLQTMLSGLGYPDAVARFLAGGEDEHAVAARTTPRLHRIINDIRCNPYQGGMASLYREGRAYDLLAEVFTILGTQGERPARIGGRLRKAAMLAHDLIMENLADPPPVEELAYRVGLSQRQLVKAFRDLFGAAPFQCLIHWRLETARAMLAKGEVSVKQVAYSMGYAHVSSFTQAYSRQFGYPPGNEPERPGGEP